ncbi:Ficolin-1 [Holothuria leucospilota]|uniref:Ficolin-1 n=1 Tax=Holothuria leucospilota TaxID=206669 RepID=A0A9Q1BV88_HOLLE|nr:Ficolin-1 [Holothuria leucospilota]
MFYQRRATLTIFISIFLAVNSSQILDTGYSNEDYTSEGVTGSSFLLYQHPDYPRDCAEVFVQCSQQNTSGVHFIKPDGDLVGFEVYCDNERDGGGWTVIQRRNDGSLDFNRHWKDYKEGFGYFNKEFWIGNEKLAGLTNQGTYQLRIDVENSNGTSFYLIYEEFRIGDEWSKYKLISVGGYSGAAGEFFVTCPPNMEYGNCTARGTCENPRGSNAQKHEGEACICPEGFLRKGYECVPPQDCECFVEEGGVLEGDSVFVNSDCSLRCNCTSSRLTCDNEYRCHSRASCEERDNVLQCYCKEGYIGNGQSCILYTDCGDVYNDGNTESGVFTIQPINSSTPFDVYCNMSDGGGWTVFQRRIDGDVDFYLDWDDYKEGFGDPNDEFWLGNDNLFHLINQKRKNYELRIDLVNKLGSPYYAKYTLFRINDESDNYRLADLGSFSGPTGLYRQKFGANAMYYHKNKAFSTKDRDNDGRDAETVSNCALRLHGAWWYHDCYRSNLNGNYKASTDSVSSISWSNLPGSRFNIQFTEMKVRRA